MTQEERRFYLIAALMKESQDLYPPLLDQIYD